MKISPRDRALLGALGVFALCAVVYLLLLVPQHHAAARLQTRIASAQSQLVSAQSSWQAGHSAAFQLKRDSGEFSASEIAVPQQSNIPAMLRLLQQSADDVHVSIDTISLSGSGSSGASSAATPETQDGVTTVPVALTFTGGYQALNRLVARLDRYVVVSRQGLRADGPLFGISSISESPGAGSGLSIQLTTNIYQYAAASTADGATSGGTS